MALTPRYLWQEYVRFWKNLYFGQQLRPVTNRLAKVGRGKVILVSCDERWNASVTHFCDYYRKLGVDHFVFIDYGKLKSCAQFAGQMEDVTIFNARGSARRAMKGYEWINALLQKHGQGKFCIFANPGEYLVFPYSDERKLQELAGFMQNERKKCLHGIRVYGYSKDPAELGDRTASDPFQACAYFDQDGYYDLNVDDGNPLVKGGPTLRMSSEPNPADMVSISYIAGVWWQKRYFFTGGGRKLRPLKLMKIYDWHNPTINVALFQFPELSQARGNALVELYGKEVAHAVENGETLYKEGYSTAYASPQQLRDIGIISSGNWI